MCRANFVPLLRAFVKNERTTRQACKRARMRSSKELRNVSRLDVPTPDGRHAQPFSRSLNFCWSPHPWCRQRSVQQQQTPNTRNSCQQLRTADFSAVVLASPVTAPRQALRSTMREISEHLWVSTCPSSIATAACSCASCSSTVTATSQHQLTTKQQYHINLVVEGPQEALGVGMRYFSEKIRNQFLPPEGVDWGPSNYLLEPWAKRVRR